ncbi:hypothetical protein V2J09_015214 [Rumex salicifolius]
MDTSPVHSTPLVEGDDEWDTEGFVIPSLGIEEPLVLDQSIDALKLEEQKPSVKDKAEEIYLGPHGAPPLPKHQELNPPNRKQRFKQKLKEADKSGRPGRDNKVESLRELVGSSPKLHGHAPKGCPREWLDPHCNESEFERSHSRKIKGKLETWEIKEWKNKETQDGFDKKKLDPSYDQGKRNTNGGRAMESR